MEFVFLLHSLVRWLILFVALIAIVRFAIGWLQKRSFQPMDRGLMSGFTGMIDLQVLLGLILIVWMGAFTRYQLEHAFTMGIAVIIAHLPMRWRQAEDTVRFRNSLAVIVVVLVLIVVGVFVLPGNRWI
jgi:hypothetical protein